MTRARNVLAQYPILDAASSMRASQAWFYKALALILAYRSNHQSGETFHMGSFIFVHNNIQNYVCLKERLFVVFKD
ncbi:hypothetical protein [Planococcus sp. ISL-109]|uniref:hypothetical protein n=1 Tax=Planococcus sp. ISL-109 TaxID=2819166 RepID=UPI001BEAB0F7|nr:hypothetical protein [Planococcus sp. ISL-109]MBT2582895.1 hypothetical protein [Planococcus sp. ISL-109]